MYQKLNEHKKSLASRYVQISVAVAFYWIVSILTVFVNKHVLSSETINLDAPLFCCWFQCLVSALICFALNRLARYLPNVCTFPDGNPFEFNTICKILPLSILFTLMVGTNNLALKYVSVAFYFIGRSLTTVFNVIFAYVLLRQRTSFRCMLCCLAIILAYWLGVDQESLTTVFSERGTVFAMLGSLILAIYSIHIKKCLTYVNQEIWLLSYYNNVYSVFLFMPLILLNGELRELANYEHLDAYWFWAALLLSGVCGLAIGFATALQIKVTSPLTHNISGTAKSCAQTIIATQWYNDAKSPLWWLSNVVVLLASAAYTRVKQLEMQKLNRSPVTQKA